MGSKNSKRNSITNAPLSRETIDELCQDTGFTEEELLAWHTSFYKDCPDGKLSLKQFEQEYAKIMGKPTQKTSDYIKHMFNVYDHDKNQFIDFKEFVMTLSAASVVNRLRLIETLFHVFDLDNDGKITKEEIGKMLHTLVDVNNANDKRRQRRHNNHHNSNQQEQTKQTDLQKRIDDAFNELNGNDDDHITKDEFIEWYMKSGLISDVQANEVNVSDTTRIQQLGKKSRKFKIQSSHMKSINEQDDNKNRRQYLARHISRMTERKPPPSNYDSTSTSTTTTNNNNNPTTISTMNDYHHDNNNDDDIERTVNNPNTHGAISSDDTDSHTSKENERWQHLFNSVLGQIRSQRAKEQRQSNPVTTTEQNDSSNFNSWKREGEEKIKSEYMKQKTNTEQNRSYVSTKPEPISSTTATTVPDKAPPSPDVITIRL